MSRFEGTRRAVLWLAEYRNPAVQGTASTRWRCPDAVTARLVLHLLVVVLRTLLALGTGLIAGWLVWRIALTHPLAVGLVSGALVFVLVFAAALHGERRERERMTRS